MFLEITPYLSVNLCWYAGCGRHIEQALAGLSKDQICSCKDNQDKQPKELNKAPITDIKDIGLNM